MQYVGLAKQACRNTTITTMETHICEIDVGTWIHYSPAVPNGLKL